MVTVSVVKVFSCSDVVFSCPGVGDDEICQSVMLLVSFCEFRIIDWLDLIFSLWTQREGLGEFHPPLL